ncbi:GFA family protein [Marinobacterium zhoushanense]|uniref:GFA family protein n=1 Tax=Marinobacterium zhoushanense TaxID=1679163 RepID=UPI0016688368|nr:GFA family protein [Marinobacterium zhoushanense]
MAKKIQGSCLCESVRFELEGEFSAFYLCYCKRCQKGTGSAHAANLFSQSAKLRWLQGENVISTYLLPKSRHARSFCQNCGSPVPTISEEPGMVVVPAGSLDEPVTIAPTAKIFVASAAGWSTDLSAVTSFELLPDQVNK